MKRSRLRWIDQILLVGAVITIGLLVIPPLIYRKVVDGTLPSEWLAGFESIKTAQAIAMSTFVIVWFVFLGGCFASFLNVVAWRVPRGRSINGSSHCPKCDGKLSMRDNVPVYGWIRNGGRCRHCEAPISPRYLIVEVILGLVTLLLIGVEVFAGGWNLPNIDLQPIGIVQAVEVDRSGVLFAICAYHLTLVYVLFTFSVIRSERLRLPVSIFLTGTFFGLAALFYSPLTCLGYDSTIRVIGEQPSLTFIQQVLTMVIGLLAGVILGAGIDRWAPFSTAGVEDAYEKDLAAMQRQVQPRPVNATGVGIGQPAYSSGSTGDLGEVQEFDSKAVESQAVDSQAVDSQAVDSHETDAVDGGLVDESHHVVRSAQGPWQSISLSIAATLEPYPKVAMMPEATACLALVGMFLGWQAVVTCVLIFVLFVVVQAVLERTSWLEPIASQTFLASILVIVFYRSIATGFSWLLAG